MASSAARHAYLAIIVLGACSIAALSLLLLHENAKLNRQTLDLAAHVHAQCLQGKQDRLIRLRIARAFARSGSIDLRVVAADLRALAGKLSPPCL